MAYNDDVKVVAQAAAKQVLAGAVTGANAAPAKKTPNPNATIIKEGRASDSVNSMSKPYSMLKLGNGLLSNLHGGALDDSQCKYELAVHDRLKAMYGGSNSPVGSTVGAKLIPTDTRAIMASAENDDQHRAAVELHERVKAFDARNVDQDAVQRFREKSMNLSDDSAGGIFRGPTQLGDLIDLMRNVMVFTRAGAKDISIPSNGLMKLPKKTDATRSYWEGEGYTLTPESQMAFGVLELVLKKLFSIATVTNEMNRFSTVDGEAMLREDMTASAARTMDKTMLQGTNAALSTSSAKAPRGLITYGRTPTPLTAWTEFQDYLIEYTSTVSGGTGADGNTLMPEDLYRMISVLPDEVQESDNLKFVGRYDLFAAISTRRADAVTANDGKGPFVFDITRSLADKQKASLIGREYVGSSQVSSTRSKGSSGAILTYLLAGDFANWVIGRLPVAEFLPNALADNNFRTDTTSLRMIQYTDGGPRHASAFCIYDKLLRA